jgi:hypothetical protein
MRNENLNPQAMTFDEKWEGIWADTSMTLHGPPKPAPPVDERVLLFVPEQNGAYGCWFMGRFTGESWTDDSRLEETLPTPSHWMPLPPAPSTER